MKTTMPEHTTCAGSICEAPIDTDTCCDPQAECASFTCPEGYLMKDPMPEYSLCQGSVCADPTDTGTCCEPRQHCTEWTCPDGYKMKDPMPKNGTCAGTQCVDPTDLCTCCVAETPPPTPEPTSPPPATCDTFLCPKGYLMKDPMPLGSMCAGTTCEDPTDTDTCCVPQAACSSFTCPDGYTAMDPMPADAVCLGSTCENPTDVETCCKAEEPPPEPPAKCSTFSCPAGFALKANMPEDTICAGPICEDPTDTDTCCQPLAKCSTLQCPTGFVPAAMGLQCAGVACDESVDLGTCCKQEKCCVDHPEGCDQVKNLFDQPEKRVILVGWEGCPCTGIARKRFQAMDLCFDELTFPNPTDPKMQYMMCQYGEDNHSFIFMRSGKEANSKFNFEKNGFFFDERKMSADTLQNKCDTAGALETCPA